MAVRDFLLPDLGEGLEDAEIVAWRVAEGDPVELNQTLVEVNTAKALVELPSPWAGVIERLHAGDGDVVKVGAPLVSIRMEDAAPVQIPDAGDEGSGGPDGRAEAGAETAPPKRRAVLVGYGVEEEEPSVATTTRLR
ncbi:MAG TPA: biotin/lipoyl-containing protein, partial [Actinomycetota bacterium]|nr:biotin/lipoyl-containing protein [Actinomycetota bacterium]